MGNVKGRKKTYPPMTSEETLKKARRQITKLNKTRSKDMERRIARTLRGRRIPMSGAAAQFKGDVEIPFVNYPGKYIIECKLSAQRHDKDSIPQIRLQFDWLTKLHMESIAMGAKFGVLIIHYKGYNNDYVFMRREDVQLLIERYAVAYELLPCLTMAGLDLRTKANGIPRSGHSIYKNALDSSMQLINGIRCAKFILPDTEYLVFYLQDFKDIVEDL